LTSITGRPAVSVRPIVRHTRPRTFFGRVAQGLGRLGAGLRLVLTSPSQLAGLFCMWLALLVPVHLFSRRRLIPGRLGRA